MYFLYIPISNFAYNYILFHVLNVGPCQVHCSDVCFSLLVNGGKERFSTLFNQHSAVK